jgi:hypothetical protein
MKTVKLFLAFATGVVGCTLSAQSAVLIVKTLHSQEATVAIAAMVWLGIAGLAAYVAVGLLRPAGFGLKLGRALLTLGCVMATTVIALASAQPWFVTNVGCVVAGAVAAVLATLGIVLAYAGRSQHPGKHATLAA